MYTEYARSLLEDVGILKMESVVLHNNITIIPHSVLYVSLSYYIINLAFQLPLGLITVSQLLCHLPEPHMIICQ